MSPGAHRANSDRGTGDRPGGTGDAAPRTASERFLRPADVAQILDVTERLVYVMMRSGELPAVKIGKRGLWRIGRTAFEAYIAGLEAEADGRATRVDGADRREDRT